MKIGARVRTPIRRNDGYGYVPGARQRKEALMMTVKSNGHANPQAFPLYVYYYTGGGVAVTYRGGGQVTAVVL